MCCSRTFLALILSINDRVVAIVAIFVKDNSLELTFQEGQPIKKKKKKKGREFRLSVWSDFGTALI